MHNDVWQLQEAKAKLSEVVRAAKIQPQFITLRGEEEVVVISAEKYRASQKNKSRASRAKKPRTLWDVLKPLSKLNLSAEEAENLFGRDRSTSARGTDASLFD